MRFTAYRRRRPDYLRSLEQAWRDVGEKREDENAAAVLEDLCTKTRTWAESPDGLNALRTELMDSVDRELIHRALLQLHPDSRAAVFGRLPELPRSDADIERYIAANALRISLLRRWAALYYGDYARGDWFETYRGAAALRETSIVRDLERLAGEPQGATRNNLDAAVRGINTSLRLRLLQSPPGARIGRRTLRARLHQFFDRFYREGREANETGNAPSPPG